MTEPGFTARQQYTADTVATVDVGEHSPADVWTEIATSDHFERALVDAVRELLAGVPHYDRVQTLLEAGVTAGEEGFARILAGLERGPETPVYKRALAVTEQFGQGEVTPLGHRLEFEVLVDGPLAALGAADITPTVAVRVGPAFRERRRDQREAACRLLAMLATTCRVDVVATGHMARWLAHEHGNEFPESFNEQCKTRQEPDTPVAERVDVARDQLDPDGKAVRLLRFLADEPGETLSYHELKAMHDIDDSRVSQLTIELEGLGLIDKYGPDSDLQVDLLPAGRALLETVDEEIGRQQRLDDLFNQTGQPSHSDVYSRPHTRGSPDGAADAAGEEPAGASYCTRYLDRADHAAAATAAGTADIVAAEAPNPDTGDVEGRHTRYVSYDEDHDEAVVAVHATTPLQYMTSVALGLASPRLLDAALPPERLDEIDDPPAILRDARCIGGLSSDAVDDGQTLRDRLVEWGEDLAELTTRLNNEDYEDRDRFCGEILRSAHGLAGTIVHLLDVAGVDVVRELRVPSLGHSQLASLARTIAVATSIQSKYGAFAAYRQLFESRDEKRQSALSPTVDAEDPTGSYIGSLVLRGPSAHRLSYHVEGAISSPATVHEDAPEFAVEVAVATPDRAAYTGAVNRMLATKNIRATPEAVTLFQALAADVYAVTEAVHWLGSEESPRTIRLDEVRVSLSTLDADQLLTDAPPSISKAVAALLRSSRPLSMTALADEAGISTRSLRRHLDAVVALDIVRDTEDGYRLALPFENRERGESIMPEAVASETTTAQDLAFDLVLEFVDADEASRLGDPDDPLGAPFFGTTVRDTDLGALYAARPDLKPWFEVAKHLCRETGRSSPTVSFGPAVEQISLQSTATEEVTV